MPLWFARLLRDGFALTAMGGYRAFADVAAQTLRALDQDHIDEAAIDAVLGGSESSIRMPTSNPRCGCCATPASLR